jgi:hypothetical protein
MHPGFPWPMDTGEWMCDISYFLIIWIMRRTDFTMPRDLTGTMPRGPNRPCAARIHMHLAICRPMQFISAVCWCTRGELALSLHARSIVLPTCHVCSYTPLRSAYTPQ